LQRGLAGAEAQAWLEQAGSPHIRRIDGRVKPEDRVRLVQRLTAKTNVINQTGILDASVLGEVVTPRDFNTLRRIAAEDNSVLDEQEAFLELASSEMKELRAFLKQPLVGAAVARLRQAVQAYSASGDVAGLIEVVRALHQQQAPRRPKLPRRPSASSARSAGTICTW
jgi:hypothetical protein